MTLGERRAMAMAHSLHEARVYILMRHGDCPQALRLASALSAAIDLLWPTDDRSSRERR
jgi:hypothetical protein